MAVTVKSNAEVSAAKFAGVTNFKVLAVNPTNEQYEKLTGKKPAYELKYEKNDESLVGMQVLVQEANTGMFMFGQFSYGSKPVVKQDGSKKEYINSELQTAWLESKEAETFEWFGKEGRTELWTGEKSVLALVKAIVQFNPKTEKLAEVFKQHGLKLSDFRKFDFKALNNLLAKKVSADIPVTYGEIGFVSLVTLNDKGYMTLKLNNENFIQQTDLVEVEDKYSLKVSRYGFNQIKNIVEGSTNSKTGYVAAPKPPKGFISLEWKAVDAQPASSTTVDVSTSPVATPTPANDDDLPF